MQTADHAKKVLLDAESELRRLIAEAAQQGDYQSVEVVAALASAISGMATMSAGATTVAPPSAESKSLGEVHNKKTPRRSGRKTNRPKAKNRSYPKFSRSGDTLIKTAWSKSKKGEYKHKSPRSVLTRLAESIDGMSRDRSVVAMESVLPIKGEDDHDVPDYQVYLCLAWLRSVGAVEQKGREGYTKNCVTHSLIEVVRNEWNNLPEEQ